MAGHESAAIMYLNFKNLHWSLCVCPGACVHPCRSAVLIVKPVCATLIMALVCLTRWLSRSWFYARRKWLFVAKGTTGFDCEVCVCMYCVWPIWLWLWGVWTCTVCDPWTLGLVTLLLSFSHKFITLSSIFPFALLVRKLCQDFLSHI